MVSGASFSRRETTSASRRCFVVWKGLASKESKLGSPAPGTIMDEYLEGFGVYGKGEGGFARGPKNIPGSRETHHGSNMFAVRRQAQSSSRRKNNNKSTNVRCRNIVRRIKTTAEYAMRSLSPYRYAGFQARQTHISSVLSPTAWCRYGQGFAVSNGLCITANFVPYGARLSNRKIVNKIHRMKQSNSQFSPSRVPESKHILKRSEAGTMYHFGRQIMLHVRSLGLGSDRVLPHLFSPNSRSSNILLEEERRFARWLYDSHH